MLFGLRIMNQQQIGVAPPRGVQGLAGALRDDVDRNARLGRELRKDVRQQPGSFHRSGRGQDNGLLGRGTRIYRRQSCDQRQYISKFDHTSSLPAVRARPANANTVALTETLIPTNTAPRANARDKSPSLV